jgi:hypothetical protein
VQGDNVDVTVTATASTALALYARDTCNNESGAHELACNAGGTTATLHFTSVAQGTPLSLFVEGAASTGYAIDVVESSPPRDHITGALSNTDGTYRLPDACNQAGTTGGFFFDAYRITNPSSSPVTVRIFTSDVGNVNTCGFDSVMTVYRSATFNPLARTTNCQVLADDGGVGSCSSTSITLAGNASETIVVSSFDAGATFGYQLNVSGAVVTLDAE